MGAKTNKEQSNFNSGPFIVALIPAITADFLDMIPIPFVDIIFSSPFKGIVAIILWMEIGGKGKKIAKALPRIIVPLGVDTLAAIVPVLDMVSFITTTTVLFAWFYAAKSKEKEGKLNLKRFI